jgi:peptide/nickel transport system substrate-binding protein
MVVDNWKEIGLNVSRKLTDPSLAGTRLGTNKMAMWVWHGDGRDALVFPTFITRALAPGFVGQSWKVWDDTNGNSGEKPPAEVIEMYNTHTEMTAATEEEQIISLGKEYLEMSAENVWTIGTVNGVPQPFVITNDLKNFPTAKDFPGEGNPTYLHALFWTNPYEPSQFYFDGREDVNYSDSKLPVLYRDLEKDPIDLAQENEWL